MIDYFIVERTPGRAFTTYRDARGEEQRVTIGARRIGPFASIPAAADYLAVNAILHASYEIETVARTLAHKCSNGASDTTDNDLQQPDPAR